MWRIKWLSLIVVFCCISGVSFAIPWTDPNLSGIGVQTKHIEELRNGVRNAEYNLNGTVKHGSKILTNIPFKNGGAMPTVIIEGYAYGKKQSIGLMINFYMYNDKFHNPVVSSFGAYTPSIKLAEEKGKVVIFLETKGLYFPRFQVRAFGKGMSQENQESYSNWQVKDEALIGTRQKVAVYATDQTARNIFMEKVGIGTNQPGAQLEINSTGDNRGLTVRSKSGIGLLGLSEDNYGGYFRSEMNHGLYTWAKGANKFGVYAKSDNGYGIYGLSANDIGVYAIGGKHGVFGKTTSSDYYGVYGSSTVGTGVKGYSEEGYGVVADSKSKHGLYARTYDLKSGAVFAINEADKTKSLLAYNGYAFHGIGNAHFSGQVGIGTTSPKTKLHVQGAISAESICDVNGENCKAIASLGSGGVGIIDISDRVFISDPQDNIMVGFAANATNIGTNNIYLGNDLAGFNQGNGNIFIGDRMPGRIGENYNHKLLIHQNHNLAPLLFGDFSTNQLGIGTGVNIANGLTLDVNGKIGANQFCDQDGNNCKTILELASSVNDGGGAGTSVAWNDITNKPDYLDTIKTKNEVKLFDNGVKSGFLRLNNGNFEIQSTNGYNISLEDETELNGNLLVKGGSDLEFYNGTDQRVGIVSSVNNGLELLADDFFIKGNVTVNGRVCDVNGCIGSGGGVGGTSVWSQGNSSIYYNTGNVGIGVSNPSKKLEVAGSLKASGSLEFTSGARVSPQGSNLQLEAGSGGQIYAADDVVLGTGKITSNGDICIGNCN